MMTIHNMDCRMAMSMLMDADSVDSIVTDPPYGLSKEPDMTEVLRHWLAGDDYTHTSNGFMGKSWDSFVPGPSVWREAYRVLKPGGYLVAFFGTRTYDLGVLALRLAGFEIRDQLAWVFGQGFPKSHNLDNERGKTTCGCEEHAVPNTHDRTEAIPEHDVRTVCETNLSPPQFDGQERAHVLLDRMSQHGVPASERGQPPAASVRAEQLGMERRGDVSEASWQLRERAVCSVPAGTDSDGADGRVCNGTSSGDGAMGRAGSDTNRMCASRGPQPSQQRTAQSGTMAGQSQSQIGGTWPICGRCDKPIVTRGLGTALKPAYEPIVLARKPLAERTVAANVLAHGTGAINIDGCRVVGESTQRTANRVGVIQGHNHRPSHDLPDTPRINGSDQGRWPASLCHDGSDEVLAGFPDTKSGKMLAGTVRAAQDEPGSVVYGTYGGYAATADTLGDSGSAARFFYCAKASKADRNEGCDQIPAANNMRVNAPRASEDEKFSSVGGNNHPTVKPTDLMRWLVRLVTPPGGTVFDPFTGSGSTGKAAALEGFQFIGCELDPHYATIAEARILTALSSRGTSAP